MSISSTARAVAALAAAFATMGCPKQTPPPSIITGLPAITCDAVSLADPDFPGRLRQYAQSNELDFVGVTHDGQDPFVGDLVTGGVFLAEAKIWPERRSLHNRDLAKDGRIIARVFVDGVGPDVVLSANLTLPRGTSWIAVCSGWDPKNPPAGGVDGLILSETLAITSVKIKIEDAQSEKHAMAYFAGGATTICVTCKRHSWCHID